jgi:hypothetical protein
MFYRSPGSLPYAQEPVTGPYIEPDKSSPYHPMLFILKSILILSSHLRLGRPSGLKTWITFTFEYTLELLVTTFRKSKIYFQRYHFNLTNDLKENNTF